MTMRSEFRLHRFHIYCAAVTEWRMTHGQRHQSCQKEAPASPLSFSHISHISLSLSLSCMISIMFALPLSELLHLLKIEYVMVGAEFDLNSFEPRGEEARRTRESKKVGREEKEVVIAILKNEDEEEEDQ